MSHQEYPKALYLQGNLMVVENEAQEADAVESGYTDWHTDQELLHTGATAAEDAAPSAPAVTTPAKPAAKSSTKKAA